ncbi:hypothetical protein BDV25DRAFT_137941 [Aspergillus avenaceus]|uniref:NACHT domain-containing protein n=1 Tax=Aspergillus avenaceus TaxID=36643 RepID=A0A5N6U1C9_ASPAV|nr:hypothetical protein BDV25DRAFT_137941 [Aspergillus avenaceus]
MFAKLCAKLCCLQGSDDVESRPPLMHDIPSVNVGGSVIEDSICSTAAVSPVVQSVKELRDLWEVAFNTLDPESKRCLLTDKISSVDAMERVIHETKGKYADYQNKRLTIRRRDGNEIKFRDVAQNILVAALQVQEVVKTVVGFDRSGYASAAWAVVSLGLTMVQNDIERRDSIFEAAEYLANKLAYFSIVDKECRYEALSSNQQLEDALVAVYIAILEYSAEIRRKHDESIAARIWNTLIPLTQQPFQRLREVVDSKSTMVLELAGLTDRSFQKRQAADILNTIDTNAERLHEIQTDLWSAEDNRILEWLSSLPYSNAQNGFQDRRATGTGDWITESMEYEQWKSQPGNALWLHGSAGCGKSVMCSTIIEDIIETCRGIPERRYAYWYFRFDDTNTLRVEHMVRSIIRQLHPIPLSASIKALWNDHCTRGSQPSLRALLEVLHDIMTSFSGEIFLMLDALDECPELPERRERSLLLALLDECLQKHETSVHILVTSRPEPDISEHFQSFLTLDLEKKLEADVVTFVKRKIDCLDSRIAGVELKARIIEELLQIPKRRFRWADLQIKRLEACHTEEMILEALSTIPETLRDTYLSVLADIKHQDREIARAILIWLCCCFQPLTLKRIAAVVSLPVPERVISICTSSLVTLEHPGNEVRLAHFSVKEFLTNTKDASHWCQISDDIGHKFIAEKAITVLLDQTKWLSEIESVKNPLLGYAARYWHRHVQMLQIIDQSLHLMIDQLFHNQVIFYNWVYIRYPGETSELLPSPIYTAARFGLVHAVASLLEQGANPLEPLRYPTYEPTNACLIAASIGQLDALDLLLRRASLSTDIAERIISVVSQCKWNVGTKTIGDIMETLLQSGVLYDGTTMQHARIHEEIVVAVVRNENCGSELLNILLVQSDNGRMVVVPITATVLVSCLQNLGCAVALLQTLIKRRDADVQITPEVKRLLDTADPLWGPAIRLLMEARPRQLISHRKFMTQYFQVATGEEIELVLDTYGKGIPVSEESLVAAVWYNRDVRAIRLLLSRRERKSPVSDRIIIKAIHHMWGQVVDVVSAVLDECDASFPLSEAVMISIIDSRQPAAVLRELLRRQQGFKITKSILHKAISRGREVLEILMNNGGLDVPVDESMVFSAISSDSVITYLLELEEESQIPLLPITDEAVSVAVSCLGSEALRVILDKRPGISVSKGMVVGAYDDLDKLLLLQSRSSDSLPGKEEVLTFLLDNHLAEVDERVVESAAEIPWVLEVLHQRTPHLPVTKSILEAASFNFESLKLLLQAYGPNPPLTETMVAKAASMNPSALPWLLEKYGSAVPLTERVLVATAARSSKGLRWLLQEQPVNIDLNQIWRATWNLEDSMFPRGPFVCRRMAACHIIAVTDTVDLSEEFFLKVRRGDSRNFHMLIDCCIDLDLSIPATERMKQAVLANPDQIGEYRSRDDLVHARAFTEMFHSLDLNDSGDELVDA